ncbi:MAG: glycoside hydrolase N-terminal domain-containing protein [Bacteroidales bacterium]|nr:glycoside hydrolase N-terminal domain-containing protein [Bacteroidales bacterium]
MISKIVVTIAALALLSCSKEPVSGPVEKYNLEFAELANTWDEAIPLGNGLLGALIWQSGDHLRISLDRVDLWDLRPVDNLSKPEFSFEWVQKQVRNNTYGLVQELFDAPYDNMPAPSKIPGAALEFDANLLGPVKSVILDLSEAVCRVKWENGVTLETFVHASEPYGWFRFKNVPAGFSPAIIPPQYQKPFDSGEDNPVAGQDLQRLGYEQGCVTAENNRQVYRQKGWGSFEYEVSVNWDTNENTMTGIWSISSTFSGQEGQLKAEELTTQQIGKNKFDSSLSTHQAWWKNYWQRSSVSLPDSILEKQYYLEMYKFGSVARADSPPISLQAVWTADNGRLPPWKGDFHHNLNTQLSYWPAYTGNYLDLEKGFLNWMWKYKETFEEYTRTYFGTAGLNVPGVTTLTGQPMGGWIQYSFGPTVASWLAHHFYLHWIYLKDAEFLKEKAYPWLRDVAVFLDEISVKDEKGMRKLPISSSPEIFDNSRRAWFDETTNFDLALIHWTYEKAAEMARELNLNDEAQKWEQILEGWPQLAVDPGTGLMLSSTVPYEQSHRHFSHLMGFHPLGLVDFSKGAEDKEIIQNTLDNLEEVGPDFWTGYSYSWQANLYARAFEGEKAAEALRIFARCFCLKNSFHVNGDQCKAGYSKMTYRPFTLEGNFAFASAIQEMLIQSHTGVVKVFPAIPADWQDVSFSTLRSRGAFLVSASMENGQVIKIEMTSEKGGEIVLENPFGNAEFSSDKEYEKDGQFIKLNLAEGEKAVFTP